MVYFLCSLRNLRSYSRTITRPIRLNTSKVVNATSMFDIVIYLHSVNKKTYDKKYTSSNESYPEVMVRELIGYDVSYDCNTHYQLTYIITILGNVVYLFFIHHMQDVIKQDICHSAYNYKLMINNGLSAELLFYDAQDSVQVNAEDEQVLVYA